MLLFFCTFTRFKIDSNIMHISPKEIKIESFNYDLPDSRIAKYPLKERDHSKLLYWKNGQIEAKHFYNLPELLPKDSVLIYNNTKVIKARLEFHKSTGARIEIFCLEPVQPSDYSLIFQTQETCVWKCLIGNNKKWKQGPVSQNVTLKNKTFTFSAERLHVIDGMTHEVRFTWNNPEVSFIDLLQHFGELPIPPYLNRKTEESDLTTYQTVYSKIDGSVAAPTAGLHFTEKVLDDLKIKGVMEKEVTLHVGAGTFAPVKALELRDHPMHREIISVKKDTIQTLMDHLGHIVAVGTTSVRTLESLYYLGCRIHENPEDPELLVSQWEPYDTHYTLTTKEAIQQIVDFLDQRGETVLHASTRIIIVPSFQFRIVERMITNFHQPKSTLLLLISAFVGLEHWHDIYDFALSNEFRFLSYGDSSLLCH